mgnify:CR=1 FL=1
MPVYLTQAKYAPTGVQGLIKEGAVSRRAAVTKMIEQAGGKVTGFWFALGDTDLYVSNMWSSAGHRITYQPNFKPGIADDAKARYQFLARGNSLSATPLADASSLPPAALIRSTSRTGTAEPPCSTSGKPGSRF